MIKSKGGSLIIVVVFFLMCISKVKRWPERGFFIASIMIQSINRANQSSN